MNQSRPTDKTTDGWWRRFRRRLRAARDIYEGMFFAPYRDQIYREYRDRRDLFLLMSFADLTGVPNPVSFFRFGEDR